MVSIGCFISVFATQDVSPLWKLMASTPGLFTMVVKLWIVQPSRKPDDHSLLSDCSRVTCTLGTFLKLKQGEGSMETDPQQVQELAAMLGQDKHQIATLLLWYIRIIASRNGTWELSFPLLMDVTTAVFLSIPVSLATNGFTWIIQALCSGILFSIIKSSMWNEEMALIVDLVLDTITPYAAYRSVLRVLGKILQNSKFRRLEAQLKNDTHFYQEWIKFKGVVEEILIVKAAYDAGGKYSQPCAASGIGTYNSVTTYKPLGASNTVLHAKMHVIAPELASNKIGSQEGTMKYARSFARIGQQYPMEHMGCSAGKNSPVWLSWDLKLVTRTVGIIHIGSKPAPHWVTPQGVAQRWGRAAVTLMVACLISHIKDALG
ncbi:hypothetical protein BDZ94DRAFT_1299941 [Collybia nuda]|uniref:Uncharacterized protein n=1 Tax=Collybia nuda TaxID=64659 RepID=A0A9P6CH01_9AGAR|nr:hypothetical protein BDZ94DRAFT_1299941 [Collybia nuda]